MLRIRLSIVSLLVAGLAACSQTPVPPSGAKFAPMSVSGPGYDSAQALASHGSGTYVVGSTMGQLPYPLWRGYIQKLDSAGDKLWAKELGSTEAHAYDVASDSSDNAYVVGYTYGPLGSTTGLAEGAAYLRKYSPSGSILWTQQFGGDFEDRAWAVAVASSGDIVVAGQTSAHLDNFGYAYVRRYSPGGALRWSQQFYKVNERVQRGTPSGWIDSITDVTTDPGGNILVAGTFDQQAGLMYTQNQGHWLRKYSPEGRLLWERAVPGDRDALGGVVTDAAGSAYIVGNFGSQNAPQELYAEKFDAAGKLLWRSEFSPFDFLMDDAAYGLRLIQNELYVVGRVVSPNTYADDDGFLTKLSLEGDRLASKLIYSLEDDFVADVVGNASWEVYVAGTTYGLVNQTGGYHHGGSDGFTSRLNGSLNLIWTDQ